jgi:hypothetical protein
MKNSIRRRYHFKRKAYVFGGGNAVNTWEMVKYDEGNDIKVNRLQRNEDIDGKSLQ